MRRHPSHSSVSSSLHLLCAVTDKGLLNNAVSIYCLSDFFLLLPLSISNSSWLFVNWPGSAERIVAKCGGARPSLTFMPFCSAFHQQTKTQSKQIKPQRSKSPVCHADVLFHHGDRDMIITQHFLPTTGAVKSFINQTMVSHRWWRDPNKNKHPTLSTGRVDLRFCPSRLSRPFLCSSVRPSRAP